MRTAELAELAKMVSVFVQEPEHTMYFFVHIEPEDDLGNDTYMLRVQYESRGNRPRHIILTDMGSGNMTDASDFVPRHRLTESHSLKVEPADVKQAVAWWLRNTPTRGAEDSPTCYVQVFMGKCVQYKQGEDVHISIQRKNRFCFENTDCADPPVTICNLVVSCIQAGAMFYKLENIDDIAPFVEESSGNPDL